MRGPTAYEIYLERMKDYYKIKKLECPSWVYKASEYYHRLYNSKRAFGEMCSNRAIPKRVMEYLSQLDRKPDDLPSELVNGSSDINKVLKEMYNELISNKDEYFINEWTLSKKGRKKMREFVDRIPYAGGIMPPENEFTNVPNRISFSNRLYSYEAEYELTIMLSGSCIRINKRNCKEAEYIDFTEKFLDRIISIAQWEKFEHLLSEKDRSAERDDSVYQDFKTVLVDISLYEYDLNLLAPNENNPFYDMLKLVWDEYSGLMTEKGLVLPWFCTLGWAKTGEF